MKNGFANATMADLCEMESRVMRRLDDLSLLLESEAGRRREDALRALEDVARLRVDTAETFQAWHAGYRQDMDRAAYNADYLTAQSWRAIREMESRLWSTRIRRWTFSMRARVRGLWYSVRLRLFSIGADDV